MEPSPLFDCRASLTLPRHVRDLLAPYFPGHDLSAIRIHKRLPWHVKRFAPINLWAYTSGNKIFFAKDRYDPHSSEGIALIAHEITHCCQYEQYGSFRFRLAYLKYYFDAKRAGMSDEQAYVNIPFEIEAHEKALRVSEDLAKLGQGHLGFES